MYGHKIILILFALISSIAISAPQTFEEVQVRWSSAYKKDVVSNYLTAEPINAPKGARVVLAKIKLLTKNFKSLTDCLVYQIPSADKPGELFFIQSRLGKSCEEQKFKTAYFTYKDIFNLKLEETNSKLVIFIDQFKISFSFYNIVNPNLKTESADYQLRVPGVLVSFVEGSVSQNILKEYEVCSDVPNDQCSNRTEDLCHLCPSGKSYQVIASNCSKPLRRYCGHKQCGEKDGPACLRGRVSTGYKGPFCITDSPMGFCEKPARVVCLNNELYCR